MPQTQYMTMDQIAAILMQGDHKSNFMYDCELYKIKDNNGLLKQLHKVNYRNQDFKKLVSEFEQALLEKTPEAKEFVKNLNLFISAFNYDLKTKDRNETWEALFKKLKDKKLQYSATRIFADLNSGNDYFEGSIVQELHATNPYATANDILWYCAYNHISMDDAIFKKGLQKLDKEFEEETKKDRPNFNRWSQVLNIIHEDYIDDEFIDTEKLEFLSKYGDTAMDMRIHIAKLEKENKKLKTELKKKKTAKLEAGIANVVKKSASTKSATSKTK